MLEKWVGTQAGKWNPRALFLYEYETTFMMACVIDYKYVYTG